MIITRSPLRITLGGGGTDLPSYSRQFGGGVLAAAIDKYVYVTVVRPFTPGIFLKYSELEHVEHLSDVRHPIIKETLYHMGDDSFAPQIEITALADIPAGTGLGSSSSFTTALIKALYTHNRQFITPVDLASLACDIEITYLNQPIGKQDQYIAAYGGVTWLSFKQDGSVEATPLRASLDTLHALEDNLLLFYTGISRSAADVLQDQQTRTEQADPKMLENLHEVRRLGELSRKALEGGDLTEFGCLLNRQWEQKQWRSPNTEQICQWRKYGLSSGAIGGKLIGAGGGGFLLFYTEEHTRLCRGMADMGLQEVRFRFDYEGTKVLFG